MRCCSPYIEQVRCGFLGSLEVRDDAGTLTSITGAKERRLLAALATACPAVVSVDRLCDLVWDGEPPATARKSLQAHVVHLRSALEPERPHGSPGRYVVRRQAGYALALERHELDCLRFADLSARGRALLSSGNAGEAKRRSGGARPVAREPYADWPDAEFAEAERHRLEGVRTHATELLWEAELALGNHAEAIPELELMARARTRCTRTGGHCSLWPCTAVAGRAMRWTRYDALAPSSLRSWVPTRGLVCAVWSRHTCAGPRSRCR